MSSHSPSAGLGPGDEGGGTPGDRFEIRGKLGSGGLGVVYRAFDRQRGGEVALKTLREVTGADLYRFKREFRTLADVSHPNLVTLHELHTLAGDWFLTMELVEGVVFIDWVRPHESPAEPPALESPTGAGHPATEVSPVDRFGDTGPTASAPTPWLASARQRIISAELRVDRLKSALYQLVDTVHALHQAGKLHRDLKPSNVLVEPGGRVVVLDFGLVAELNAPEPDKTHESSAVGTPAYMSPEQAADGVLTPASDWYSVGVMLYEALTGRRPVDVVGKKVEDLAHLPPSRTFAPDSPAHLDDLCMRLLSVDAALRPDGEQILATLGGEPSPASRALVRSLTAPPFVGREAELTLLRGALDEVRGGAGVAVFVRGVSGMGKTSLLRHFLDEAAIAHGTVVLKGRCYERESVPFKTLDAIVDSLASYLVQRAPAELAALVPRDAAALARLFPVLLRVPAFSEPATRTFLPPDPLELRRRAFGALRDLLAHMAARQPVVLAIDDVQWGDADSGTFFAELLHHPDAPAMLLIVAHRSEDEDVTPLLAALRRSREAMGGAGPTPVAMREITLGPLGEDEARALLGQVRHDDGAWIGQVVRESGGNPMFLSELARVRDDRNGGDAEALSLEQVILARIERLGDEARALLGVCALAARPLRTPTGLRAAGLVGEGSVVTTLAGQRLLRVRQTSHGSELETYHDRIRSALLGGLEQDEIRHLHRTLAATLEGEPRPDHEALVAHWLGAGLPERASSHAALAATAAEDRLAFHMAAELYRLALAHGQGSSDEQRHMRTRMGHALMHSGALAAAADAFKLSAETATSEPERLELRRLEMEQRLRCGQVEAGVALAGQLLQVLGFRLPSSRGSAVLSMIGQRALLNLRGLDFKEKPEAEIPAAQLLRLDLMQSLSNGFTFANPIYGRALQTRLIRETLKTGEPRRVGVAFCLELGYLGTLGVKGYERAMALGQRTIELGKRLDYGRVVGHGHSGMALAAYLSGHWRQAYELVREGERVLREEGMGVRWELDLSEFFRSTCAWLLGDARELVRLVSIYLRDADERGDAYAQRGLRGWRTNVAWLVIGQPEEARAQLAAVEVPLQPGQSAQVSHYYELTSAALIDLYQDAGAQAHQRVEALWPAIHKAMLTRIQSVNIEGAFLRARAALATAAASRDAGVRAPLVKLATACARTIDREATGWGAGFAASVRAGCARLTGETEREAIELRAAIEHYQRTEMTLFAAATRRRLGLLQGGDEGAALVSGADELFKQQGIAEPRALSRVMFGLASE